MKMKCLTGLFAAIPVLLAGMSACTTAGGQRLMDLPLSDEPLTGKFVWHDLITDDVDQVKRFYGGLLDWTFEDTTHPNGGDYTLVMSGDRFVAGIVHLADPVGVEYSRWLGYLSVEDVDRAVDFNRDQGGRVAAGPLDLEGIGRAAAIEDPQSAVVGLIRSEHGDPDDSLGPGPGLIVWNELLAADESAAADFYSVLADLDVVEQQRQGGVYRILVSQDHERAGLMQRPGDDIKPFWLTHFAVENVIASTNKARELGGKVLLEPDPGFRNGLQSVVVDPGGAVLALRQWTQ